MQATNSGTRPSAPRAVLPLVLTAAIASLLAGLDSGCWNHDQGSGNQANTPGSTAATQAAPPEPVTGDPKQVVLLYTGDTLSIVKADNSGGQRRGGLSALTSAIGNYETTLVDYNRKRVENEGGDPTRVTADFVRGLLGEHPYLLLDYGGWSRPNDPAGDVYVGLYFQMFHDLHYSAVGCKLFERLTPERWEKYLQLEPQLTLLVTTGQPTATALPVQPILLREMHGQRWGVVSVPLPRVELKQPLDAAEARARELVAQAVEQAALTAQQAGCDYVVLLLSEGPGPLYLKLREDPRFIAVIGGPPRLAPPDGFGDLPPAGPLILPELAGGGQEAGVCHLIYPAEGERPTQFFFTKLACVDEPDAPLPYRKQVDQAVADHTRRVQELPATP